MIYSPRGAKHFVNKINVNGPYHQSLCSSCWLWTGYKFSDGYGGIMVRYRFMRVHRYSWEVHVGEIAIGLHVLHKCDNPLCVNPGHLFLGSERDNKHDCMSKDRHARGMRHGSAKLSDADVHAIRRSYKFGKRGFGASSLAKKFGVSKPIVLGIVSGKAWKHLL